MAVRVLILGAYGAIGSAVAHALRARGHAVTGLGRSAARGARLVPGIDWAEGDLSAMEAQDWAPLLARHDVVVNAAGALQDTPRDDVAGIHRGMISALLAGAEAAGAAPLIVQISAAGADPNAGTRFMAMKGEGDALLASGPLPSVILRPALVIGPQAYGGTALLRAAAALPVTLDLFPESRIACIGMPDLAEATVAAVEGRIPPGTVADLREDGEHSLAGITSAFRRWLGFPDPRLRLRLPRGLLRAVSAGADLLGRLGWRSPMRSTALTVLEGGVGGDPGPWQRAGGTPPRPLAEVLSALPSTVQERWFARLFLAMPLAVGTLAVFWLASGLIGLVSFAEATALLKAQGTAPGMAAAIVALGSVADMALGAAILVRRWARRAALGMILLGLGYLVGGSIVAPVLWLDPLGAFVKVLPATALAALAWALLEER